MFTYGDLDPGEVIFRIPETVVSAERLTRLIIPGHPSGGRMYTGEVRLVTMLAGIESTEIVRAGDPVHVDETGGCA